jgi:hypothetical protein
MDSQVIQLFTAIAEAQMAKKGACLPHSCLDFIAQSADPMRFVDDVCASIGISNELPNLLEMSPHSPEMEVPKVPFKSCQF